MTTIGKYRHLQRLSKAGRFFIAAIDHRANLLEKLNATAPKPYDDAAFRDFKQQVIATLSRTASGLLTDPAYGIAQGVAHNNIEGTVGIIAPIEVTDYGLHPSERDMQMIPGWSVRKIKLMGGDGVKLLLPYHPQAANVEEKYDFVRGIIAGCAAYDIPFFLEPIPYALDPSQTLTNAELLAISVQMCETFSAMGVDVLKLPFPVDHRQSDDLDEWHAACATVDRACSVPWALLSAGVDFATFAKQARVACAAGASGVIVGRAVWAEAVDLHDPEERGRFLREEAGARMASLAEICEEATPWHERVEPPSTDFNWYERYLADDKL